MVCVDADKDLSVDASNGTALTSSRRHAVDSHRARLPDGYFRGGELHLQQVLPGLRPWIRTRAERLHRPPRSRLPPVRKRVFHLVNETLGKIRDSSDTRTGLEVADADCTTAGKTYGGGQWRAWLSSSLMNAIDRLADVGPWYRLDQQTKLFENRAGITQGPLVPIEDPADAGVGTRTFFWSGTLLDGTTSGANCTDWTEYVGGLKATVGRADTAGPGWVAPTLESCSTYASLLCFEQ